MRVDNVPAELLDEAVREQLFGRHKPYAMPTAGYADDVKKLGVNDLTAFYRRFYAPNNAVLIVAGDTTAEAVRKLAEKYYGPIPAPQGRAAAAAGRGRHRPAAARDRAPMRGSPSRAGAAISWRRPIASAKPGMPMRCRCWRGCSAAARPAACRARWSAQDKIALSASAGYGAASLGLTSFEIAVQPARGRSVAEIETAVGDADEAACSTAASRPRRSSGRRTSCWRARSIRRTRSRAARASTATRSPPAAASPRSTPGRRRIAAVRAGRRRGRRAPCLARRRRGHLAADAGGGLANDARCAGWRWRSGSRWSPRAPRPSRSRKSPRRSASRPGWSRTGARRSWRCPSPSPAAAPRDPESQKGADQPHREPADRRRGVARRAGLQAAPGGCLRRRWASAPRSTMSAARCALLSANRDEAFELLRLAVTEPRFDADRFEQRRAQTIAGLNQAEQRPASVAAAHHDGDGVRGPSLRRQRLGRARDSADPHRAADQGARRVRC